MIQILGLTTPEQEYAEAKAEFLAFRETVKTSSGGGIRLLQEAGSARERYFKACRAVGMPALVFDLGFNE